MHACASTAVRAPAISGGTSGPGHPPPPPPPPPQPPPQLGAGLPSAGAARWGGAAATRDLSPRSHVTSSAAESRGATGASTALGAALGGGESPRREMGGAAE
eukprot:4651494-Prymnesium_polylepis.1